MCHYQRLRSFTAKDPSGHGANIGVILYQRAFYVGKANQDLVQELLAKPTYATGGMQVAWDADAESSSSRHVSVQIPMVIYLSKGIGGKLEAFNVQLSEGLQGGRHLLRACLECKFLGLLC